jgi:Xaa-Pro aminopeptidase
MNQMTPPARPDALPFDVEKLDDLMERAGIDALVVSSKHNLRYLLGGYQFFFFAHFDAIGLGRYVPMLVYPRRSSARAAYFGNPMEKWERDNGRFWVPDVQTATWYPADSMRLAVAHLMRLGLATRRIAVERSFLPADAVDALRAELPHAEIVEALPVLEKLRAVKSAAELELVRSASDEIVGAMQKVMGRHRAGATKFGIVEALRQEEVRRGLEFEYCLVAAGSSLNRAPSPQVWQEGDVLSLDSGGNCGGYIGDVARMAVLGEPDGELQDLLGEVDAIQQAARKPIAAGVPGREIYASAMEAVRRSTFANSLDFVAHGMGMILHESPRLSSAGPVPYANPDADLPLEAGMVVSIETALPHPRRGYIKLEDTVAVTKDGWEAYGDFARGWNRGGII